MSITENIKRIRQALPSEVKLVVVSKNRSTAEILEAYEAGQRIFGENKIQELITKYKTLPRDIEWHMIGHVQTNKVKLMAPFVQLIHGIDSLKVLKEVNKCAVKHNRVIDCLLQIKISNETTKFGMTKEAAYDLLDIENKDTLKNVRITGLMGMASFTGDKDTVQREFSFLRQTFDACKAKKPQFKILSMGMSDDYPLAIDNGSTMVRLGSVVFGKRQTNSCT